MKIYTLKDRITLKIDELIFKIAPLSSGQKEEIQAAMIENEQKGSYLAIKYAVKDVEGVEKQDGSPYVLEFENDILTDACLSDVLNFMDSRKLQLSCLTLLAGIPQEILHPLTKKKVEGVKIINPTQGKLKK